MRLPTLKELKCPSTPELACKPSGQNLFLIDSISGDAQFTHAVKVPDGFLGAALPVPHPAAGTLFVKLRDNPSVINATTVTAQEIPAADDSSRAAARTSALRSESQTVTGIPSPPPTPSP